MQMLPSVFAAVALLASTVSAVSPIGVLSQADQSRLGKLFSSGLESSDLSSIHYSAAGLSLLRQPVTDGQVQQSFFFKFFFSLALLFGLNLQVIIKMTIHSLFTSF